MADTRTRGTLANRLKLGTRALHSRVERAGVMADLIRGRLDRARYCLLLRNLHEIYLVLDEALSTPQLPAGGEFPFDELCRASALRDDLQFLFGPEWQRQLPVVASTTRYVQHLERLRTERPAMLIAHGYLRHLGDLNGGQILRQRVRAMLGLDGVNGTSFYEYPPGRQAAVLAARYREQLDTLELSEQMVADIVDEARFGFVLHEDIFNELATQPLPPAASPGAQTITA